MLRKIKLNHLIQTLSIYYLIMPLSYRFPVNIDSSLSFLSIFYNRLSDTQQGKLNICLYSSFQFIHLHC